MIYPKRLLITASLSFLLAMTASAETARDIMLKVDKVARESYSSSIQKVKLSTCKYGVSANKMRCVEEPRIKVLESVQKDAGVGAKDTRSISILLEPIGEKGIGMLTYDYDDPEKDADTWLYLSALGKVKRMISSSEDSDESGSFFGTEFSIEDVETNKVDDYTYSLSKEETFADRPTFVIESIPTEKKSRKSRYGKSVSWVDRERFIVLKVNLFNRHGKPYKQLTVRNTELIDKVWISRNLTMNNLVTRRITNMDLINVAFNIEVPDEFLTQRTLTDFAFRERELVKLRKFIE
jgi:hypothetical protein